MITITEVSKVKDGLSVRWNSGLQSISLLSVVFDDEGSCTNIGLNAEDTSFVAKSLSRYRTYDIYLKALTPEGWTTSNVYTYRLD